MEHRCVGDDGVLGFWSHSDGSSVDKNGAVCDGCAKDFRIGEVVQGNLAGSTLIQFCNDFLGSSEEIVSDVEYIDLSYAVEGCLYQDCSSSAAGTEQSHLFADDVYAVFCNCSHEADTVGGVSSENAVVVDDGITCAGDLRSRRNLVCQFAHDIFARHGDVPASCTHGAESFDCLRHFVFRYIKGKVAIIKAELVACFVVHFRRNTVCNRASE